MTQLGSVFCMIWVWVVIISQHAYIHHVNELKYSTRFNLEFRILTFPKFNHWVAGNYFIITQFLEKSKVYVT